MTRRGGPLSAALLAAALSTGCPRAGGPTRSPADGPAARGAGLDVVLVTVDTLRADATGFGGNTRGTTPNLDRLAAAGADFTFAHALNVVTLPSHANLLTGLPPHAHGVRDNTGFRLPASIPTLATRLKAAGYATGAFVAAFPLDRRYGLANGFDVYDDRYGKGSDDMTFRMPERPAAEVVARAMAWWEAQPAGRRFLWVHVFEPHAPYAPPPPFDARFREEPYLGEVAAADAALAPVVSAVLDAPRAPVLAVVTGDHGEALGDHGELTHGLFCYEATLAVPLVVAGPGFGPRRDPGLVSHLDVAPTVLAAAGLPADPSLPGTDLRAPLPAGPRRVYFEALSMRLNRGWAPLTGILRDRTKYVDLPLRELYDLASDPHEGRNLADRQEATVRDLARAIPEGAGDPGRRAAASPEEVARLRALGYVASSGAPGKETFGPEDDPKSNVEVDRKLQTMIALYQQGDLAGGIRLGEEVLRKKPGMVAGYEHLAFLYQQADRLPEAARLLSRALSGGLESAALRVRLGMVLSEMGRPKEAVAALAPLEDVEEPEAQNALGVALSDAGEAERADAAFARALRADPENAVAWKNRGIASLRAGNPAAARAHLSRALSVNPALPGVWNALGTAEARLGATDAALAAFARAFEQDPRDFDALYNLGTTAAASGRLAEAGAALRLFSAGAPSGRYAREIAEARRLLASLPAPAGGGPQAAAPSR